MNRESPKAGQTADPAFTSRELVERIINEAIAGGAFDQALQDRLQAVADPKCSSSATERHRHQVKCLATALKVSRLLSASGASQ